MNETVAKTAITISLTSDSYILGEPMPLTVTYINVSNHSFSMKQPDKLWEVRLEVTSSGGVQEDEGFGRIQISRPNEQTERYIVEKADTITLRPKESYTFQCDITARFPEILPPGQHLVRVIDQTDDDNTIESNELPITIRFTPQSVSRLLVLAADETKESRYRQWAAGWLRELKPDFQPRFAFGGEPESVLEDYRKRTQDAVATFNSWWAVNQYNESTNRAIQEINDHYFIPEEEAPEDENE